jgi:hypothetical protein
MPNHFLYIFLQVKNKPYQPERNIRLRVMLLSKVLLRTRIINLRNWDKPKMHVD